MVSSIFEDCCGVIRFHTFVLRSALYCAVASFFCCQLCQAMPAKKLTFVTLNYGNAQMFFSGSLARTDVIWGTALITKQGHITIYSDESKVYRDYKDLAEFRNSSFFNRMKGNPSFLNRRKDFGASTASNAEWTSKAGTYLGMPVQVLRRDWTSRRSSGFVEISATKALPSTAEQNKAMSNVLHCENPYGLSLRSVIVTEIPAHHETVVLDCKRCEQADVPANFYDPPHGYKMARDDFEVLLGGSGFSDMLYTASPKSSKKP